MEEIITIVVLIGFGFIMGWHFREYYAKRVVESILKDLKLDVEPEAENQEGVKINLEKHNGVIYVYATETNEFLGQSPDIYELDKILSERFPGKKFILSEKNLAEVGVEL